MASDGSVCLCVCMCKVNSCALSFCCFSFLPFYFFASILHLSLHPSLFPPLACFFPLLHDSHPSLLRDHRLREFFRELPTMASDKLSIIEHLFFVIGFMFKDDKRFMEDYRCVCPHSIVVSGTGVTYEQCTSSWLRLHG